MLHNLSDCYWLTVICELILFFTLAKLNFTQAQKMLREIILSRNYSSLDPLLNDRKSFFGLTGIWTITWVLKTLCLAIISITTYIHFWQQ